MRVLTRGALEIVCGLAQQAYKRGVCRQNPVVGDLVFEPTLLWCHGPRVGRVGVDVDAIGWLHATGQAPYVAGDVGDDLAINLRKEMRLVWDIYALSGRRGDTGIRATLRFENCEFWALPNDIAELVGR